MLRPHDIVSVLLRWLLGSVFIFSGAVKCVDPVGTAIYVDKYLATYSLSAFAVVSDVIAVALIVVEFAVGLLLELFAHVTRATTIATRHNIALMW